MIFRQRMPVDPCLRCPGTWGEAPRPAVADARPSGRRRGRGDSGTVCRRALRCRVAPALHGTCRSGEGRGAPRPPSKHHLRRARGAGRCTRRLPR
ncbi:hypothetical protein AKJ09_05837 [Labilithrix luteola]|uniref:Uncharacterized protein n=1 Tax=Labilithrix luteola TaxID=1391654 RepID=A0A0K1Q068_9BACT|nr:hypothetical protein AKJ09_05837 [Labilithrix luteola]